MELKSSSLLVEDSKITVKGLKRNFQKKEKPVLYGTSRFPYSSVDERARPNPATRMGRNFLKLI